MYLLDLILDLFNNYINFTRLVQKVYLTFYLLLDHLIIDSFNVLTQLSTGPYT